MKNTQDKKKIKRFRDINKIHFYISRHLLRGATEGTSEGEGGGSKGVTVQDEGCRLRRF